VSAHTYRDVTIPASAELVALTRTPHHDELGAHLYDEYCVHLKVPPGADVAPCVPAVAKVVPRADVEALEQLRVAVREACAGAVCCRVKTLHDHVVTNAGRFRTLNDLTYAEMADLAFKHLTVTSVKGELFVG
jgi:hypothetical protein